MNKTIKTETHVIPKLCMKCFLCGDSIELNEYELECSNYGYKIPPRICDDCKNLWIEIKKTHNKK